MATLIKPATGAVVAESSLRIPDYAPSAVSEETPTNGINGLKHWKSDVRAGMVVSMVSLPLSLGIAIASGAPPICGIISSIIAGLIFPFIGGAFVTISGPAAGLAPVVLCAITTLGHGNAAAGYHVCLVAIFLAGCLQLILSQTKAARLSKKLPSAAIEGMLASIGILLIMKQFGNLIGNKFHEHDFFPMLAEVPSHLGTADPKVLAVGLLCLAFLFAVEKTNLKRFFKLVPVQLAVVVLGTIAASVVGLDKQFLIQVPSNILNGMVMPDFGSAISNSNMWWPLISCVLTLTFVDAFESLATIHAVDKLDPYKRASDPDRTLLCMGTSNILSSMVGGLTIIPGGIKSTTNIMSGGKTLWANFYNALFLIAYVIIFRDFINMIPLAVLAGVLIHIGYELAAPRKWTAVARHGMEDMVVFVVTIIATLATDLLIGLLIGSSLKLVRPACERLHLMHPRIAGHH